MGDLADTMTTLFNYPGAFELAFTHRTPNGEYSISRSELSEAVGGLDSVDVLAMAREFLLDQEASL